MSFWGTPPGWVAGSLCIVGAILGCGSDEEGTTRAPGIPKPPSVTSLTTDEQAAAPTLAATKRDPSPEQAPQPFQAPPGEPTPARPPQPETGESPKAADDTAPTKRNLGGELIATLRPEACLDAAAAGRQPDGKLEIEAEATIAPSGRLIRASVRAPGQPPSAIECLERQLESSRLRAPIPEAPVRVSDKLPLVATRLAPSP